jgi:hypothetical protein
MPKYSMHCPVEGCQHVMEAEADNDDEAVTKLMAAGDDHFAAAGHPADQSMTAEIKESMTRQSMKKEE